MFAPRNDCMDEKHLAPAAAMAQAAGTRVMERFFAHAADPHA
jgi:hypothetical protein